MDFQKNDLHRLSLEFLNFLLAENEGYLDYNKNEEEAVIERFLDK